MIEITTIDFRSSLLPEAFSGCKILHISDLHNKRFGKGQCELIAITKEQRPDYIFVTGDMIDQHHRNMDDVLEYFDGIIGIAPIYYVTGNHEWQTRDRGREFFNYIDRSTYSA